MKYPFEDGDYILGRELKAVLETFKAELKADIEKEVAETYAAKEVTDITAIDNSILDALKPGDVVIKNESGNKHAYICTFKEEGVGLCLTYADADNVETVSYDKSESGWDYNSTDKTHIGA